MYKITTESSSVTVTQDHSLLDVSGLQIKPVNLQVGQELLHKEINNQKVGTKVISIEELETTNDYVYDLETETGNFQAGIGCLIVKNTDSCMVHLKDTMNTTIKETFDRFHQLEKDINKIFPQPLCLELEKIYGKYLLLTKKRYIGEIINEQGNVIETDKKGVVTKRRDNCLLLQNVYKTLTNMVMEEEPRWKIYKLLSEEVSRLIEGKVDINELVITKSLKSGYKAQNLPHLAVSVKMKTRGKYVVSGTRIRYIFLETENAKDPQYKKAEDPDYFEECERSEQSKLKIDYVYYLEKQLVNPIDEMLEVRFKQKDVMWNLFKLISKGHITNVSEYFDPKFTVL